MCSFPSWFIENGTVLFLTDKDIEDNNIDIYNGIGHEAIEQIFKLKHNECRIHYEGYPCPPEFAKAINDGKCNKMMTYFGWVGKVNEMGQKVGVWKHYVYNDSPFPLFLSEGEFDQETDLKTGWWKEYFIFGENVGKIRCEGRRNKGSRVGVWLFYDNITGKKSTFDYLGEAKI